MWTLRSLAYATDLFVAGIAGEVVRRDRYVVVRTPRNPDYIWGNYLLYPEPPDERAAAADGEGSWTADHARELPGIPTTLFGWDRPDGAAGATSAFVARGFEIDESTILTATRAALLRPGKWNPDVRVAPLVTEDDWRAAARAQTNAFAPRRSGTIEDLTSFVERQLVSFRKMQERGLGQWWGAWVGSELAGSLGLVRIDGALRRFQLVGVDPRFARLGVCSTMVYEVAGRAFDDDEGSTLVMAADAAYHAAHVYESVGFRRAETLMAVIKKPPRA